MSGHERPVEPFSDLHVEHEHVRATLLHDPTIEGLDVALYLDGSASMNDEYEKKTVTSGGGFLYDLFGWGKPPTTTVQDNQVEPQARWMLQYLASKDRDGEIRVGYWACGTGGTDVEILGELSATGAEKASFGGPHRPGKRTILAPAMKDYVRYLKEKAKQGCKRGCAVIITDGQIHDAEDVHEYSAEVAKMVATGRLPRVNFVLVGVGSQIDEAQLEKISHQEFAGVGHLWCHRVAAEIKEIAELVAVLVDETMTVASGGTITDDNGKVLKIYEGRLPAVLEFEVPEGCKSFTLEVNGQKYTQPMPDEDEHHDDDDDDDDHH